MSGLDRTVYNTRQQLLSTDLNDHARISARNVIDAERYARANVYTPGVDGGTEAIAPTVLGGLIASPGTGAVSISPGMLCQAWPGTGTPLSAFESPAVLARLATATDVALPVPGSDTYYLVQARATETVTNTPGRLIWNPTLNTYAPAAINTRIENTIEFNVKAGTTTNLPLPDAGWVPVAGVLRRTTDANPEAADIYDLRPLRAEPVTALEGDILQTDVGTDRENNPETSIYLLAQARIAGLGRLYAESQSAFLINDARFLSPGTVYPVANTWYYVYLCSWGGTTPRNQYTDVLAQGVLVISSVPPELNKATPSAFLPMPAPFANELNTNAICVGMFKGNLFGTGIYPSQCKNRKFYFGTTGVEAIAPSGGGTPFFANTLPTNARGGVIAGFNIGTVTINKTTAPAATDYGRIQGEDTDGSVIENDVYWPRNADISGGLTATQQATAPFSSVWFQGFYF